MVPESVTKVTPNQAVFQAQDVSKSYSLVRSPLRRLAENLLQLNPSQQKLALAPLTMGLSAGQSIGLIGKNGAGKSTLLQIAAGVLAPSTGRVLTNGRVAALLELGAGLLPDLTGRENIRFAGPLWGLSAAEIEAEMDHIVSFSELGQAIDAPLRTYSSGMVVRLAFSLATIAKPALLIIDEALSVGDGQFAQKSFDRIMQLKREGTCLLFCSHSLYQVEMLCEQAIWLHDGQVMDQGPSPQVCRSYRNFLDQQLQDAQPSAAGLEPKLGAAASTLAQSAQQQPSQGPQPRIRSVTLLRNGQAQGRIQSTPVSLISRQDTLSVAVELDHPGPPGHTAHLAILIKDENNRVISSLSTANDGITIESPQATNCITIESPQATNCITVRVDFASLPLLKGQFRIDVILMCEQAIRFIETVADALSFEVVQHDKEIGVVSLAHTWQQTTTQ